MKVSNSTAHTISITLLGTCIQIPMFTNLEISVTLDLQQYIITDMIFTELSPKPIDLADFA